MPPKKKQKTIGGQSDLRSFFPTSGSTTKKDTKRKGTKTGTTNDDPIVWSDSDDSFVQNIHDSNGDANGDSNGDALVKTDTNNIDDDDDDDAMLVVCDSGDTPSSSCTKKMNQISPVAFSSTTTPTSSTPTTTNHDDDAMLISDAPSSTSPAKMSKTFPPIASSSSTPTSSTPTTGNNDDNAMLIVSGSGKTPSSSRTKMNQISPIASSSTTTPTTANHDDDDDDDVDDDDDSMLVFWDTSGETPSSSPANKNQTSQSESANAKAKNANEPPPVLWPLQRLELRDCIQNAKRHLRHFASEHPHYQVETNKLELAIANKIEELYQNPEHLFWKHLDAQDPTRALKSTEEGVYFAILKHSKTKFGSALNLKKRTDEQENVEFAVMVMTTDESIEALGIDFIHSIIQIGMPSLYADLDQQDVLENWVARQVVEGIIGCAYSNDCWIYFERLTRLPIQTIRDLVRMDRMELCWAIANGEKTLDDIPDADMDLCRAIKFMGQLSEEGEKIPQLFSWPTLKCQNHDQFKGTDFMNVQRELPAGEFLKNELAKRRCGSTYNGYTDPVKVSPSSIKIDNCLSKLRPLLEDEQQIAKTTGDKYRMESSASSKIREALSPITSAAGFDQYEDPSDELLGSLSKMHLDDFLNNPSAPKMIQTQNSNIKAIQSIDRGWLSKNFETETAITAYGSTFVKAQNANKLLVFHSPHYRIFSHNTQNKVRLKCAADYIFHLDVMVATKFLEPEVAKEYRLLIQSFLIHLLFDAKDGNGDKSSSSKQVSSDSKNCFYSARNLAFPKGWFKPALPGIRATSKKLGVHEQVLIYLYNKLGDKLMRLLIEAFGLMVNNPHDHLPPFEPNAKCHGLPAYSNEFGSVEAKPCPCIDKDKRGCLYYYNQEDPSHPLAGYMACHSCFSHRMQPIHWLYLEETDPEKLAGLRQKNAEYQRQRIAYLKEFEPEKWAELQKQNVEYQREYRSNLKDNEPEKWAERLEKNAKYQREYRSNLKEFEPEKWAELQKKQAEYQRQRNAYLKEFEPEKWAERLGKRAEYQREHRLYLQEFEPEKWAEQLEKNAEYQRRRIAYLKEFEPEKWAELQKKNAEYQKKRIAYLKEFEPEKWAELQKKQAEYQRQRIAYLKEFEPEKWAERLEKNAEYQRRRMAYLKENEPEKWAALQRQIVELQKLRRAHLKEYEPEKWAEQLKRHAIVQANYKLRNPSKVAANEANQNTNRVLDADKRAERNNYQREHAKQLKADGKFKMRSGTNRAMFAVDKFYAEDLRNKMKQSIYILIETTQRPNFFNTTLIQLLDGVRNKSGLDDHFPNDSKNRYYKPEYTRCISAFLKPLEDDKTKNSKQWVPHTNFDPNQKVAASNGATDKNMGEVVQQVVADTLDETKFIAEKAFADGIPFGVAEIAKKQTAVMECNDDFHITGKLDTLQEWYNKWKEMKRRDDTNGGAGWRQGKKDKDGKNKFPKNAVSYLNKIFKGIDRIAKTEKREIEDVIGELQVDFVEHGKSLEQMSGKCEKIQKNYYKNKKKN